MVPMYVLFRVGTFADAVVGLGFAEGDGDTAVVGVDDADDVLVTEGCVAFDVCVAETGGLVAATPENNAR